MYSILIENIISKGAEIIWSSVPYSFLLILIVTFKGKTIANP